MCHFSSLRMYRCCCCFLVCCSNDSARRFLPYNIPINLVHQLESFAFRCLIESQFESWNKNTLFLKSGFFVVVWIVAARLSKPEPPQNNSSQKNIFMDPPTLSLSTHLNFFYILLLASHFSKLNLWLSMCGMNDNYGEEQWWTGSMENEKAT